MGFHDAVVTYGKVINETMAVGGDIFDGLSLARRFTNRSFMGVRGKLTLDENNDLNGNFELWNFRFESGIFQVQKPNFQELYSFMVVLAESDRF